MKELDKDFAIAITNFKNETHAKFHDDIIMCIESHKMKKIISPKK